MKDFNVPYVYEYPKKTQTSTLSRKKTQRKFFSQQPNFRVLKVCIFSDAVKKWMFFFLELASSAQDENLTEKVIQCSTFKICVQKKYQRTSLPQRILTVWKVWSFVFCLSKKVKWGTMNHNKTFESPQNLRGTEKALYLLKKHAKKMSTATEVH